MHSVPVLPRCCPRSKESYQMGQRITKRTLGTIQAAEREFTIWDDTVTGFGLRVRPGGAMSYVVVYRAGLGRDAAVRRYTIASVGKIAPEDARARAKVPAIVFSLGRSYLDLLFLLVDRSPLRLLLVGCGRLRGLLGLAGALHVVRRRLDQTRHEALDALGP